MKKNIIKLLLLGYCLFSSYGCNDEAVDKQKLAYNAYEKADTEYLNNLLYLDQQSIGVEAKNLIWDDNTNRINFELCIQNIKGEKIHFFEPIKSKSFPINFSRDKEEVSILFESTIHDGQLIELNAKEKICKSYSIDSSQIVLSSEQKNKIRNYIFSIAVGRYQVAGAESDPDLAQNSLSNSSSAKIKQYPIVELDQVLTYKKTHSKISR